MTALAKTLPSFKRHCARIEKMSLPYIEECCVKFALKAAQATEPFEKERYSALHALHYGERAARYDAIEKIKYPTRKG